MIYSQFGRAATAVGLSIFIFSGEAFAVPHDLPLTGAGAPSTVSRPLSGWDGYNSPGNFSQSYEYRFSQLPAVGRVATHTPWPDTYWPTREGGINKRWMVSANPGNPAYSQLSRENRSFGYYLRSEAEVRAMSREELTGLSPAEKYDIFMGRFDYPLVYSVRAVTRPGAPDWAGICNGWAPAALRHPEPAPVDVMSAGGILVPFGASDVKALLSHMYWEENDNTAFLGRRCTGGGIFSNPALCNDVNAGAFHIVMANELGRLQRGFLLDIDPGKEVWNQPAIGYHTNVVGRQGPSRGSARGTVEEVIVQTTFNYTDETDPQWASIIGVTDPATGGPSFRVDHGLGVKQYQYSLELDAYGNILGGTWYQGDHPDFLWQMDGLTFKGRWEGLNQIYRPSPTANDK